MPTIRHTVYLTVAEVGDEDVEALVATGQWELEGSPVARRQPRARKAAPVEEPKSEE